MDLTLKYIPDVEISINGIELPWGIQRDVARSLLLNKHKADDKSIDLSAQFNGSTEHNIYQRRDIYENFLITGYKQSWETDNLFFLGYDKNNLLSEVEVHTGLQIIVFNAVLSFERTLSDIVQDLQKISPEIIKLEDGEYFFKELKLTISDETAMGGDGDELGYFYCSINVDHLIGE